MSGLSQRIVDFIAELLPLYTYQHADGHDCALSLIDGTLIMPLDESQMASEEGWVAVLWQGDSRRRSEVLGNLVAAQAILRHVELHGIGRGIEDIAAQRQYWCQRFRERTGCSVAVKPV